MKDKSSDGSRKLVDEWREYNTHWKLHSAKLMSGAEVQAVKLDWDGDMKSGQSKGAIRVLMNLEFLFLIYSSSI